MQNKGEGRQVSQTSNRIGFHSNMSSLKDYWEAC